MRVKPYAMRSLTARHTALWAPGGSISTSGCSCRYRSSLRTWSGGPGGISCTGQYRYRASNQHKSFPKSHATRLTPSPTVAIGVPSAVTDGQVRKTNPTPPPHVEPLPSSTGTGLCAAAITGLLATGRAPIRCSGTDGRGPTRPHADVRKLSVRILLRRPAYSLIALRADGSSADICAQRCHASHPGSTAANFAYQLQWLRRRLREWISSGAPVSPRDPQSWR
jgi:hypothetical protein